VNIRSIVKLIRFKMADLEAQSSKETDKMLDEDQGDDDDLATPGFGLPVQLSHLNADG